MAIKCPHCSRSIKVRNATAGEYTPLCPKCGQQFSLTIPEHLSDEWKATPLLTATVVGPIAPEDDSDRFECSVPFDDRSAADPPDDIMVGIRGNLASTDDPGPQKSPPINRTLIDEYKHEEQPIGTTRPASKPVGEVIHDSHSDKLEQSEFRMPSKLGGYEIVKEIGRGGMGAVYLARQVSLDRPVALKVMSARWASDPIFLARFTREAYAAAQLVHHNVVQIYDIGQDKGLNFYSMEYVKGQSLGQLIQKEGKVDPAVAVGYALQAARGLKFAHDRGMIHRDVKPDNLMLNEQGIVKVADLGLVKTPEMLRVSKELKSDEKTTGLEQTRLELAATSALVTNAQTAMGSPAFMSPEQCANAARVDHRADIYSLGCSLYMLLTGRTPFRGNSALEVMTKHATKLPPPPTQFVKTIPEEISAIVMKTLEKSPAKRHRSLDEMIGEMERWLDSRTGGGLRPSEAQISTLEDCVERYDDSPVAKLRNILLSVGLGISVFGFVACLLFNPAISVGLLGMLSAYAMTYFIVSGIFGRNYLFRMARPIIFGIRAFDWALLACGLVLFALILNLSGFLLPWFGFSVAGAILAFAVHFLLDKQVDAQRHEAIEACENMFKRMRVNGFNEESLRHFVARNAGLHWEEFFEALFGYEAKLIARAELGDDSAKRARHAVWREPILRWIERVRVARDETRERKHLETIEAKMLEAQGVDSEEAKQEAEETAAQMVEQAAEIKKAEMNRTHSEIDLESMLRYDSVKVSNILLSPNRSPRKRKSKARPRRIRFDVFFGWRTRFVLALLLIAGGVLWERQHFDHFRLEVGENPDSPPQKMSFLAGILKQFVGQAESLPLTVNFLPEVVAKCFNHINPLIAGLIVLLSVFSGKTLKTKLLLLSGVVVFALHLVPFPDIGGVKPYQLSMAVGVSLAIVAFGIGRKPTE